LIEEGTASALPLQKGEQFEILQFFPLVRIIDRPGLLKLTNGYNGLPEQHYGHLFGGFAEGRSFSNTDSVWNARGGFSRWARNSPAINAGSPLSDRFAAS
jgi:hypothetical protein